MARQVYAVQTSIARNVVYSGPVCARNAGVYVNEVSQFVAVERSAILLT